MMSGIPPAVLVEVPKLWRMSLWTMPLWLSTFGPFEPLPGNGPAVSSGSGAVQAETGVVAVVAIGVTTAVAERAPPAVPLAAVVAVAAGVAAGSSSSPQPTRAMAAPPTAAPESTFRALRRCWSVCKSN